MALGILPLFACSLPISLSKAAQKYGIILLSHEGDGAHGHLSLPSCLEDILQLKPLVAKEVLRPLFWLHLE